LEFPLPKNSFQGRFRYSSNFKLHPSTFSSASVSWVVSWVMEWVGRSQAIYILVVDRRKKDNPDSPRANCACKRSWHKKRVITSATKWTYWLMSVAD
jgi:hypothetical protein